MSKVYRGIPKINPPDLSSINNYKQYKKDCDKYVEEVVNFCKVNYGDCCKEAGKEIQFQVHDGFARYIIATLKPVRLIHITTGDAYQFPYVYRLTAADIRSNIVQNDALEKLFS